MAATSIALTCDDLNAIDRIVSSGAQGPEGDVYQLERIFSGRHGNIMKYNLNNINKGHHLDELCRRYIILSAVCCTQSLCMSIFHI